jgi:hypothetical protein
VRGEADLLRRSAREGDRFLGELLSLALEIPSEDSVRVVAGQPVLVAWGHAPVAGPAAPELLIAMTRRAGVAAPGGGGTAAAAAADTAAPMRILGPPPAPPPAAPVRRGWLGPGLAFASLLLIPLARCCCGWIRGAGSSRRRWSASSPATISRCSRSSGGRKRARGRCAPKSRG